jgi:glycosyltransferase involved in cell wall biosynthesis
MKPLVSILIPAYNAEPWIADTIRSALQQTWARKEIIIVDDGSTDRTRSIAKTFSSRDVLVTSRKNGGAAAARNAAYSLCSGDYIQWLDADDLLAPDKITRQMEIAQSLANPRALLASEWGRFLYRLSRAKFSATPLWVDLSPVEWLLRKLGQNLHQQPATWLVSRELTQTVGPWNEQLSLDDDGEYFCRVVRASEKVHFVSGARCFYRATGAGSLSVANASDRKLESQWRAMQLQVEYLRSLEDSPRTRAACLIYLQNFLEYLHPWRPDLIAAAERLAESLGGRLQPPQLRWKYAWLENILGRPAAARAQQSLPYLKLAVQRSWDRAWSRWERGAPAGNF